MIKLVWESNCKRSSKSVKQENLNYKHDPTDEILIPINHANISNLEQQKPVIFFKKHRRRINWFAKVIKEILHQYLPRIETAKRKTKK